ncbi:methionyl-tRNA formyltransferase [Leptospira idonii]|uniref:Methionyl-tRNA formyltransferase n=1 Tax=Leptospira idonii TaxID=1193500 RepID=A0A4R9LW82_9LEPT|nr:methionyl-tRNA formyltransferase [Leptospira idonii]TGN18524.1 methionyl-tRNA formyltransferase [Leptospira idonii]
MSVSIGFFGSPSHARDLLKTLFESGIKIDFVVTNIDKPAGRKKELTPTPVKVFAEENSLPVIQSERLRTDAAAQEKINSYPAQIHIVYAYGSIVPEAVFLHPKYGSINLHGSLLPKFRGASPVQSFLLGGEKNTGYTIQFLAKEVDSGDIISQEEWETSSEDTTESLLSEITKKGSVRLLQLLSELEANGLKGTPQNHSLATHCKKMTAEDRPIHWERSAYEIHNRIRALYPDPLAFTEFRGKRVILNRSFYSPETKAPEGEWSPGSFFLGEKKRLFCVCGDGNLIGIETVQPEGKKPMSGFDFFNGARVSSGERFT